MARARKPARKARSKKASDLRTFVWGFQFALVAVGLVNLLDYFELQQGRHRLERISATYLTPDFKVSTAPAKQELNCDRVFDCFLTELKGTRSLLADSKTLAWVVNVGQLVADRAAGSTPEKLERAKLDKIEVVLWSLRKFHEQPKVSKFSLRFVWKREQNLQRRYLEDQWFVLSKLWQGFGVPQRSLATSGRRPAVTVMIQGNYLERKERLLAETRELQSFQAY